MSALRSRLLTPGMSVFPTALGRVFVANKGKLIGRIVSYPLRAIDGERRTGTTQGGHTVGDALALYVALSAITGGRR
jgi:hypothetical protein